MFGKLRDSRWLSGEWGVATGEWGRLSPFHSLLAIRHSPNGIGLFVCFDRVRFWRTWIMGAIKFDRAISTGKLNASPRLHTQPINVVVFHGSQGSTRFEVGFPLRCLQRLSRPYVATLHCGWRHNSSTRGMFIPVLSY